MINDRIRSMTSVYDNISEDHIEESLAQIILLSHTSYSYALNTCNEIFHRQGKQRIVVPNLLMPKLFELSDVDEAQDESLLERVTVILNQYIDIISDPANYNWYKMAALYVIILNNEERIISKVKIHPEFAESIDMIVKGLTEKQYEFVSEFVNHFIRLGKPLLAHRTREVGVDVFSDVTSRIRQRYYGDIDELEEFDNESYQLHLHLRDRFIKETVTPKINRLCELIGIKERYNREMKNEIIVDLENLCNEESSSIIGKLML